MIEDQELKRFLQIISCDIKDRASGGAGSSGNIDFKENVFTEYVIEHISEAGIVENAEVCHFKTQKGNSYIRVNGDRIFKKDKNWKPDDQWYRDLIAKAIIFKKVTDIVKKENFSAYKANIVTYLVAYFSLNHKNQINLNDIWNQQQISADLEDIFIKCSHVISEAIRKSAGKKNVTEWCKKEDCWKHIKKLKV